MKTEDCRELAPLARRLRARRPRADERAGLEAHLEGCPECRAEAESLSARGAAAAARRPGPLQPAGAAARRPELAERIAAAIGARAAGRRGASGAGASASPSAARRGAPRRSLALFVLPGGGGGEPEQHVEFASLPAGVKIDATLEPHAYGTEIRMYVKGVRSGHPLPRLPARRRAANASRPAPSATAGATTRPRCSARRSTSRAPRAIGVHAGNRTFVAPVDATGATATDNSNQEDVT